VQNVGRTAARTRTETEHPAPDLAEIELVDEAGLTLTHVDGRSHRVQRRRDEVDHRFPSPLAAVVAPM
jgi:hypothetical protein